MAWPHLGPFPPQGPIRDTKPTDLDPEGGHPTAPGKLDKKVYPRLPVNPVSPGSGVAGRPRYKQLAERHGRAGGMLPGATPNGPMQPGVVYDDGESS